MSIQLDSRHDLGLDLTSRELGILQEVSEGLSNQAIADRLTLSLHTVRNHVQRILTKLDAHSKLEAVMIAYRQDLIAGPDR
jgi:DNA-binding NarL/FixJ family response regulator